MDPKEIEARGYKSFSPPPAKPYISKCWQKRVRGTDFNTLYFITIYEYTFVIHNEQHVGYETEIQFYQKETRNALNLQFLSGWSLEDIERKAEEIYSTGFVPYEY